MRKVLTIAGSDSSGGAGIQADLKTFSAHGVYGMSVITAVTAQNTQGVYAVQDISAEVIAKQLAAVFEDIAVDAVKIGMVSQPESIQVIAGQLRRYQAANIVLDPVMISKSGYHLLHPAAKETLLHYLFPLADLVTPNLHEARAILDREINSIPEMEEAAAMIFRMGPRQVLVKGGHLEEDAVDVLFDGQHVTHFQSRRIVTPNTHGTGCTLSSAIASNLALGYPVGEAVARAKEYITDAIRHSFAVGQGVGPVHHFYKFYEKAGV